MPYEGLLFHSKSFYKLSQKYDDNLQDLQLVKLFMIIIYIITLFYTMSYGLFYFYIIFTQGACEAACLGLPPSTPGRHTSPAHEMPYSQKSSIALGIGEKRLEGGCIRTNFVTL